MGFRATDEVTHEGILFASKRITRSYLDFLKTIEGTEMYNKLDNDYNACLSVYRHSLCCLLGLESVTLSKDLQEVTDKCIKHLSKTYNFKKTSFTGEALLQSCIHCIGFAKKHAEGRE